jgi:hypothetical protein
MRNALKKIGMPPFEYGTHSLRIGAATTLAILGFPSHFIQVIGRWKSLSYQLYVRLGERERKQALARMASSQLFSAGQTLDTYPYLKIGTPNLSNISNIRAAFNSR